MTPQRLSHARRVAASLRGLSLALAAAGLLTSGACARAPAPDCALPAGVEPIRGARSAGCLVVVDGAMMAVRLNDPGHKRHGRLAPPGGSVEAGEAAQCTAVRETWEEAGVHVRPGRLLHRFENGFHLFRCTPTSEADLARARDRSVPEEFADEVSEKVLFEPAERRVRHTGQVEAWAYDSNSVISARWSEFAAD